MGVPHLLGSRKARAAAEAAEATQWMSAVVSDADEAGAGDTRFAATLHGWSRRRAVHAQSEAPDAEYAPGAPIFDGEAEVGRSGDSDLSDLMGTASA